MVSLRVDMTEEWNVKECCGVGGTGMVSGGWLNKKSEAKELVRKTMRVVRRAD
jgi:hypothetical protein